jgi:zinc/manganese transport system ATP-binding protein
MLVGTEKRKEKAMQKLSHHMMAVHQARHQRANPVAAVQFSHVSVQRGKRIIWSHGTFQIPPHSVVAIVGTNGAGKTTLLNVELGLIPVKTGTVRIWGEPAGTANQHIGYVPQNYATDIDSNITAEQSVALGLIGTRFGIHWLKNSQRAAISHALELSGIADKANLRLSEMSGGMRQRVAIAQALVSNPQLLLLDEPFANLDIPGQRELVRVLADLNEKYNMTIQIVSHDLNLLLPILTGAIYLLDGHPHYAPVGNVMDSKLLTHLYGTHVEVLKTAEGDMYVRPDPAVEPKGRSEHTHTPAEAASFHVSREPGGEDNS